MPLYDFTCNQCSATVELLMEREEAANVSGLLECLTDGCAGEMEREEVSSSTFSLKGDGWAKDLYSKPEPSKS